MSDHNRRIICRAGFALLCLLPTLVVLNWIWSPATAKDWENQIRQSIGVTTEISEVTTPLPQLTILKNVSVKSAAGSEEVKLGTVTLANTERFHQIAIQQLEANSGTVVDLLKRIYSMIDEQNVPVREQQINLAKTVILSKSSEGAELIHELHDVKISLLPKQDGFEINLSFKLSPTENASTVAVAIERRDSQIPSDSWNIDCRNAALPISLLSELLPNTKCLGDAATFQGTLRFDRRGQKWDGIVCGKLDNVDLWNLVFNPFGKWVNGLSRFEIAHCQIVQGKITSLEGDFDCRHGEMGLEFLASLINKLHLTGPSSSDQLANLRTINFESNFGFQIVGGILSLKGDKQGVLMRSIQLKEAGSQQMGAVLVTNPGSQYDVEWLIEALSGTRQSNLPPKAAHAMCESIQLYTDPTEPLVSSAEMRKEMTSDQPSEDDTIRIGRVQPLGNQPPLQHK